MCSQDVVYERHAAPSLAVELRPANVGVGSALLFNGQLPHCSDIFDLISEGAPYKRAALTVRYIPRRNFTRMSALRLPSVELPPEVYEQMTRIHRGDIVPYTLTRPHYGSLSHGDFYTVLEEAKPAEGCPGA